MKHKELRKKWKEFLEGKNHREIPSVPLPSYSDPTLLFVNSGMFPMVPYLEGETHPLGKRLFNIQRSIRPMEFEEIGDNRHTSVFEMMGNWSLGDYFKEEQLINLYEFAIEELGLDPKRLYASVFAGDKDAQRDEESIKILQGIFGKYGVSAEVAPDNYDRLCRNKKIDLDKYRIFPFGKSENWWKRGDAIGELGGPDSEFFYDLQIEHNSDKWGHPHPATDSGRFIELGNSVFMEYKKGVDGWKKLKQKNVDYGGGFERLAMVLQGKTDIFSTDLYMPAISKLEDVSGIKYIPDKSNVSDQTKAFRVIADHIKGAVFMIADGVTPSNKEQGYILRRAIRRAIRFAKTLNIKDDFSETVARATIKTYGSAYPYLSDKKDLIIEELHNEEKRFSKTINKALKELDKKEKYGKLNRETTKPEELGIIISDMLSTYGFPVELAMEELAQRGYNFDKAKVLKQIEEMKRKHQDLSRAGAEQRFKGGLADTKELTVRYHTLAHLLLAALQKELSKDIHQKGQNITDKRLRFDFNFERALTDEEKAKIEKLVNEQIEAGLDVIIEEHTKDELEKLGVEASFLDRYPDVVKVFKFVNPKTNEVFSYEACGGPHVENTSEITKSGKFKIAKEQSSGAGVRRIRGVLE